MRSLTTLDLNDRQFLKVRIAPGRAVVYFRVAELRPNGRPWRTLQREIRADLLETCLDPEHKFRIDFMIAHVSNVLLDAVRLWGRRDREL